MGARLGCQHAGLSRYLDGDRDAGRHAGDHRLGKGEAQNSHDYGSYVDCPEYSPSGRWKWSCSTMIW